MSIVDTIKQQRTAYLDSPELHPYWKHGWHAAVDHVARIVEQEYTTVQVNGTEYAVPTAVAEDIARLEAALINRTPIKSADPRYVPGVSEHDDDMTDAEWVEAMGLHIED